MRCEVLYYYVTEQVMLSNDVEKEGVRLEHLAKKLVHATRVVIIPCVGAFSGTETDIDGQDDDLVRQKARERRTGS